MKHNTILISHVQPHYTNVALFTNGFLLKRYDVLPANDEQHCVFDAYCIFYSKSKEGKMDDCTQLKIHLECETQIPWEEIKEFDDILSLKIGEYINVFILEKIGDYLNAKDDITLPFFCIDKDMIDAWEMYLVDMFNYEYPEIKAKHKKRSKWQSILSSL